MSESSSAGAWSGTSKPPVAALLADQDRRWQQGERVLVEEYLRDLPALWGESDIILDLLYQEIVIREERGEPALLDEYLQRFPQFSEELRLHFEVHAALPAVSETFVGHGPSARGSGVPPRAPAPPRPVVLPAV